MREEPDILYKMKVCQGKKYSDDVTDFFGEASMRRNFSALLTRILLGEQWNEKCQECLGHVYSSSRKSIN